MKFYLAASYTKRASMRAARNVLEALGHEVTSEWIDSQIVDPVTDDAKANSNAAITDMKGINDCDAVLVFTDKPSTTGGLHVEFGYAYGMRKRIIIIGPVRNVFHHLPNITVFEDWNAFLVSLGNGGPRHLSSVK